MTKRAELLALASRVEAGTAEQQADLIQDAWDTMGPLVRWTPGKARRFGNMLDAEAFESAALLLVPEDYWSELKGPRKYLNIPTPVPNRWSMLISQWNHEGQGTGWAVTPGLAITAASLRALAEKEV